MSEASAWTLVLWTVQGLLALFFLAAGAATLIGCAEVLGAAGLVLSMATAVLSWLPPLAAAGLAVVVGHALGAIVAVPVAAAPETVREAVLEDRPLSGFGDQDVADHPYQPSLVVPGDLAAACLPRGRILGTDVPTLMADARRLAVFLAWEAAAVSESQAARALGVDRVTLRGYREDAVRSGTAAVLDRPCACREAFSR